MSTVVTKTYPSPALNRREMMRYAGCKSETADVGLVADEVIRETAETLSYKVCFREFRLSVDGDDISFDDIHVTSRDLAINLSGCSRALFFAATVGLNIDRRIALYSVTSPAKAVIAQGYGAERVESLTEAFVSDLPELFPGFVAKPRFSPGYGDLPLDFQREIFAALSPERNLGMTLLDNMLMSPSKSVTAIVGLKKD